VVPKSCIHDSPFDVRTVTAAGLCSDIISKITFLPFSERELSILNSWKHHQLQAYGGKAGAASGI
jgi:hypothetical protein